MKYKIVDNTTGQSYIFEGNSPPTEADVDNYLSQQVTPEKADDSLLRYLEPQTLPFLQNLFNMPTTFKQAKVESKEKGPFAAPSSELRALSGGTSTDTGNRFLNSLLDALKTTSTATRAGAEVGTGVSAIKALIPYLTYGGINKLKDKLAAQSPDAFKGADLQNSLVEKLTAGNKLGNVQSDVETTVNDLLTRRMPEGFSGSNLYNAGNLNQLGQNIGKFEQGYMSGTPGNVVRTAVTDIVKDVAPATKFPYKASAFLNKIGKIPAVGGLLKNPITWPIAAWGSTKIPKTAKVLLGIQ
jgi:hypothetical protein